MKPRVLVSGVAALTLSAAVVVACGDDDAATTPAQVTEAGPVPAPPPSGIDAAPPVSDGGTDAPADAVADGPTPAAAIVPQTITRIANAINPYGLLFASDGFLYASGATIDATADRVLAVWRFKDGVLDTTFGTAGVMTVPIDGSESSFVGGRRLLVGARRQRARLRQLLAALSLEIRNISSQATFDAGSPGCPATYAASTARLNCDPRDGRSGPCVYSEGVCACVSVPYCEGPAPRPEDLARTAWQCKPTRGPKDCPESVVAGGACKVPGQVCGGSSGQCGWSTFVCTCRNGKFTDCKGHEQTPPA